MKTSTKKFISIYTALIAIGVLTFWAAGAYALEVDYPAIPTPTGTIDLNCLDIGACNPSIAMFIVVFYGASIWAGSIIAFLALLYTGLTYILGGANPGLRAKAKQRFVDVVWGLAILLMVNTILFTINPEILGSLEEPTLLEISGGDKEFSFLGFTGKKIETGGGGESGGTIGKSCFDNSDCSSGEKCSFSDPADPNSGSCVSTSGGGGNIATIYDSCTTPAECETKYGSNYTCDRTRKVCIGKYEECVYSTDNDSDLAICWSLAWGGGGNYDKERPGCGTNYNPNCHTLVDIKQNVRTELDKEFSSKPNVADTFFDIVIPRETGQTWNPASEAKNGVNCTPVGLYQLEDKTRMNPGGKCPEGIHKDENYEIETAHAADVYFNRSCRYWAYWAEMFGSSSQCP